MTSLESKAISRLRFPLMMGVVLIHCVVIEPSLARNQGLGLTAAIIQLFSLGLTGPCVPLFFFISGYLFFFKYAQRFTVADYGQQLGKRVRTLSCLTCFGMPWCWAISLSCMPSLPH